MSDAIKKELDRQRIALDEFSPEIDTGKLAQSVINAAWVDFDLKDESTWPEKSVTEIHQPWLFDDGDSNIGVGKFDKISGTFYCFIRQKLIPQSEINAYLDPANIMKVKF